MTEPATPSSLKISVILCTHNPREDYLRRTLDALKAQALPQGQWEFLLVDNASKEPLAGKWDLSWHPQGRHVREETLGLTPARLRGIAEARAPLLVFVDDDNLLAPDYLERAIEISEAFPFLGVWGGRVEPQYDQPPPEWARPYVGMLALRDVPRDVWSNLANNYETCPVGAGMVVRSAVARHYATQSRQAPGRVALGRTGSKLTSGEDADIAYTACDMGLGMGLFQRLHLRHLIPPGRLQLAYLLRLRESIEYSGIILASLRQPAGEPLRPEIESWRRRLWRWLRTLPGLCPPSERLKEKFNAAGRRGRNAAVADLARVGNPSSAS